MNIVGLTVDSFGRFTSKLPMWARLLLAFWIVFSGVVYFEWIDLPVQNEWLRMLIMVPMLFIIVMIFTHMVVTVVTWISSPFRKAAKVLEEKRHG